MVTFSGIGAKNRANLSKVLEDNSNILTADAVAASLNLPLKEASRLLSRWCNGGWVRRIKRGTYVPFPVEATNLNMALIEPFVIVHSIYKDGYIGGFSAIKHWDLSEQIIETTYYFTTKQVKDRNPTYGNFKFKIKTVSPNRIFGIKSLWYGSQKVSISDPSKTIVDILNDPKLVGGMTIVFDLFQEYLESEHCNLSQLIAYAEKMNNKTIFKRLGFMIETKSETVPMELENIEKKISTGYSNFDPLLECDHIIEKWKLKVPESWKREYDRKK